MHKYHLYPALACLALLLQGCSTSFLERRISAGVIEYALSFPDYDPNGIMSGMLPERTTLTFADDKQLAELNAGMGIFRTSMVVDTDARSMDYHMSMMSKKIRSHLMPRDMVLFNADLGTPTILFTNDVDTVAGLPCKRAVAIFDRIEHPEIEIWYTDRIDLTTPNWYGPFAEVPGVLLRYEMVQYGMRMRLDAISVKPGPVDPAKFLHKEEYEQVAPTVMHHEMSEVLGTFSM
jgi:hypothetical protein